MPKKTTTIQKSLSRRSVASPCQLDLSTRLLNSLSRLDELIVRNALNEFMKGGAMNRNSLLGIRLHLLEAETHLKEAIKTSNRLLREDEKANPPIDALSPTNLLQ